MAAVDYITAIYTKKVSRETIDALMATYFNDILRRNGTVKKWGWNGYQGWTAESVQYGTREDSSIVRVAGSECLKLWETVGEHLDNCTRLDLAVTVLLEREGYDLGHTYFEQVQNVPTDLTAWRNYSIIMNTEGGTTFYVGKRSSGNFGRIYDKGAESSVAEANKLWRYEVEIKKPLANLAISDLMKAPEPASFIKSYVHQWFTARGINPVFDDGGDNIAMEVAARAKSIDRTLGWLTTQVRASIERLKLQGYGEQVKDALKVAEWQQDTLKFEDTEE